MVVIATINWKTFFSFICSILDNATYVPKSMNYYELTISIGVHQSVVYKVDVVNNRLLEVLIKEEMGWTRERREGGW